MEYIFYLLHISWRNQIQSQLKGFFAHFQIWGTQHSEDVHNEILKQWKNR